MYSQEAGKLITGRTRGTGKVVDEWTFKSPLTKGPKMDVQISIEKSDGDSITFVARSQALPGALRDQNIETLRSKVEEALRTQHQLLTGLVWESWLEVQVRGAREAHSVRADVESRLEVKYCYLKRAVHPVTGDAYTVNHNGVAVPFPLPKLAGEADTPEDVQVGDIKGVWRGREPEAEYSYVPATDENVAGLEDLMARMQALRGALSKFLRQDTINQSLEGLTNPSAALPAPL